MMKCQRCLLQPPPKRREEMEPLGQYPGELLGRVWDRGRGGIQDSDLERMHVIGRGLVVPEVAIDALQSPHHHVTQPIKSSNRIAIYYGSVVGAAYPCRGELAHRTRPRRWSHEVLAKAFAHCRSGF